MECYVEKLVIKIAWLLPQRLVYWCAIRLWAYATCGRYGNTVVSDITFVGALKRWETK